MKMRFFGIRKLEWEFISSSSYNNNNNNNKGNKYVSFFFSVPPSCNLRCLCNFGSSKSY